MKKRWCGPVVDLANAIDGENILEKEKKIHIPKGDSRVILAVRLMKQMIIKNINNNKNITKAEM